MTQENPVQKKSNIKVIALAIVCVILAASLVGVIAVYQPSANSDLQTQITQKDNTISALQTQNANLQSQISQINNTQTADAAQITYLQQSLSALNDQLGSYENITLMQLSEILVYQQPVTQDANTSTPIFNDALYYSGYVVVQATATANTTYAEVIYNYAGANFDYNQTLGTSGSAVFPVLPGSVQINIGNTHQTSTNTATATATYFY